MTKKQGNNAISQLGAAHTLLAEAINRLNLAGSLASDITASTTTLAATLATTQTTILANAATVQTAVASL